MTVGVTQTISAWADHTAGASPVWGSNAVTLATSTVLPVTVDYYDGTVSGGQMQLWVQGPWGPNHANLAAVVPATWFPSSTAALPDGWALSAGSGLSFTSALISSAGAVLTDPSGATHVYPRTASGGFTPPAGEDAVVATDANGNLSVAASDGTTYVFNADGTLASANSGSDDLKPAAPGYGYSTWNGGPPRLTSVTDTASGKAIVLSYGAQPGANCLTGTYGPAPANALCRIDYSAFGVTATNLYYANGHLARIEDPGATANKPLTDYAYDASGRITGIRDVLNNDLIAHGTITDPLNVAHMTQIGYDGSGRVTGVTAPLPDQAGSPAPHHGYNYSSVTTTAVGVAGTAQPNGYTRQVTLDAATGNVTADGNALGQTTTYTWQGNLLLKSIDPTGLESTTIYDSASRPTDSYGPGATTEFTTTNTSTTAPHASTAYDESIVGLAASYYNNLTRSGAPAIHGTGVGDVSGAMDAAWGTTPPAGLSTGAWSARFTGEVKIPAPGGVYSFSVTGTGSAALYVNDALVTGPVTLAAGPARIRVDYTTSGSASFGLDWTPPSLSSRLIPGTALDPRYGLVTSKVDADGKKSATEYSGPGVGPEVGLATAQITDPGGLTLTATTAYEHRGTGYYRPTSRTLPSGVTSTVTDAYYAVTETSTTNNCLPGGVLQRGLLKSETGAGTSPVVHNFVYDLAGRMVPPRWPVTPRGAARPTTPGAG